MFENLPEVHRGRESPPPREWLSGRCLITEWLMSQVIRVMFQNGEGAIKLLEQHDPGQFVG
jgi:hypothetical protein